MTQQIHYKQMARLLLAVSEALHAAIKHQGLEANDITFEVQDADGNVSTQVSTVEDVIEACRDALGIPRRVITTTEHEV